jgi:hypothetical protein
MSAAMESIDDEPIRLKDAVEIAFPNGGAGLSALRKEVRNGNLGVMEIAGKLFTTRRLIREMKEKCLVKQQARASGSARSASTRARQTHLRCRLDYYRRHKARRNRMPCG